MKDSGRGSTGWRSCAGASPVYTRPAALWVKWPPSLGAGEPPVQMCGGLAVGGRTFPLVWFGCCSPCSVFSWFLGNNFPSWLSSISWYLFCSKVGFFSCWLLARFIAVCQNWTDLGVLTPLTEFYCKKKKKSGKPWNVIHIVFEQYCQLNIVAAGSAA